MVISYTVKELDILFTDSIFLSDYDIYKTEKEENIHELNLFVNLKV